LAALGFFIWFGGSVIRTAVAYDLFEPGSALTIKSYYSDLQKMETVRLFAVGALYTDIAYGVALVSSIILCAYWKQYLKKRGWLKSYIKEEVNSVKSKFKNKDYILSQGSKDDSGRFIDYLLLACISEMS